jgi:hypothetical protein
VQFKAFNLDRAKIILVNPIVHENLHFINKFHTLLVIFSQIVTHTWCVREREREDRLQNFRVGGHSRNKVNAN